MSMIDSSIVSIIGFVIGWWAHVIVKRSESEISITHAGLSVTAYSVKDVEEIFQMLAKFDLAVQNEKDDEEEKETKEAQQ